MSVKKLPDPPRIMVLKELVVAQGGPRHGQWFVRYVKDGGDSSWEGLITLTHANGETPTFGRTLGYVTTRGKLAHPRWHEIEGTALQWNPPVALERIAAAAARAAEPDFAGTGHA